MTGGRCARRDTRGRAPRSRTGPRFPERDHHCRTLRQHGFAVLLGLVLTDQHRVRWPEALSVVRLRRIFALRRRHQDLLVHAEPLALHVSARAEHESAATLLGLRQHRGSSADVDALHVGQQGQRVDDGLCLAGRVVGKRDSASAQGSMPLEHRERTPLFPLNPARAKPDRASRVAPQLSPPGVNAGSSSNSRSGGERPRAGSSGLPLRGGARAACPPRALGRSTRNARAGDVRVGRCLATVPS